ncbi:MAG: lipid-A-disaccharide synthase [Vulcanimicrobiaceae bacterium]
MKLRVFAATGEASGDMLAAALAGAMRARRSDIDFVGIGSERMAAAGFELTERTTGWASMGPLEALRRIPPLFASNWRHALWIVREPWDLIVLVDFGAYNLRLAKSLRMLGYRRPILYLMPPGAWFDQPARARTVARTATALTAFEHQRDFYRDLGLPIAYFGHPLASLVTARPPREPAPPQGGIVAVLPGSRRGEIERHLPRLVRAMALVRAKRPRVEFLVSAADADCADRIARALHVAFLPSFGGRGTGIRVVRGAREALDGADAAWIASGTAVLEATLREVPTVALYVVAPSQETIARRVWRRPYVTLPNLLLGRPVVPELLQSAATPSALATALETLLADPAPHVGALREVRAKLGPADALEQCARFALELARPA